MDNTEKQLYFISLELYWEAKQKLANASNTELFFFLYGADSLKTRSGENF